ncbi:choice-of-anchor L domain-containing protein [Neotabrizicola shimadae]|uniref:Choice-of-anchor L domain-containing protein n=1 Tax=Neotabrizicola shimadae TaxID=2807096 RepID=A0A8G0ZTL6_9RHOB|nr:choice-of-anchor L domain-containing protein [Neotabrizicola shimadae]QYZ69215.1 choice-of-anchor L domain-containing protein [Neotabrizicola shimadae]
MTSPITSTTPVSATKLPVETGLDAMKLAETMFGDGIKVISASYKGDPLSAGIYEDGEKIANGAVPSDEGIILSTGYAATFTNGSGASNQVSDRTAQTKGVTGDDAITKIAGVKTFDGAFLESQFVPEGDTLTMRLVFASEEYLEWVKSGFNDAVGIWVNGQKIELALGDGDISIDNINTGSNANLFIDNRAGVVNTEMDGLTVVLTLKAAVKPGEVNSIRIGIADAGDRLYDSALLIVADSVQTSLIAKDDLVTIATKGETVIDLLANDSTIGRKGVQITHLNDVEVKPGQVVALPSGDRLQLNDDGTVSVFASATGASVVFTYTITDEKGTADTAFVTVQPSPVDGTAGNDQMHVGYMDKEGNVIDGTDGLSDVILGYGGDDKVTAGDGDDDIYGGDGNDFVRAGNGTDLIVGGAGNDVLDGQAGADRMEGGTGDDVYWIDDAGDVISEAGGGGYDKVMSSLSHILDAAFEELWLTEGSSAALGQGNAADNKIVGNSNANTLSGLEGNDQLFGEAGDDLLYGGSGNDNVYGGAGRDLLDGGDGSDKLFGGSGQETLQGGAGADTLAAGNDGDRLIGGSGNDLLVGGLGEDVFVFAPGSGKDTVKSFTLGVDHIDLQGFTGAKLVVSATSALLQLDKDTSVSFTGITDVQKWTMDALIL